MKNAITMAILLASSTAFAQVKLSDNTPKFMGVGKMAVTESFAPNLLVAAIEEQVPERIENWDKEKTLVFPYDNKRICLVTTFSLSPHYNSYDYVEMKASSYGTNITDGMYPFPTECNRLPLIQTAKYMKSELSPSIVKYRASIPEYEMKGVKETQFKTTYVNLFIDKLEDNQWDQLLGLIVNSDFDFENRKKAFYKFKELYIDKGAKKTPAQQGFIDAAKESYRKYPSDIMLQKEDFWAAEDPITYLFRKSYAEVIKYGKSGSYNNAYKQEKIPKLTVNYFVGKSSIDYDSVAKKVMSMPSSDMQNYQKIAYLKALQSAEILKLVMTLKGLEVNKQDIVGNTLWHNTFSDLGRKYAMYENNFIGANLTRAMLVMGANPMLLNKDGKSSYMLIKELANRNPEYKYILDAFEMDPYVDR